MGKGEREGRKGGGGGRRGGKEGAAEGHPLSWIVRSGVSEVRREPEPRLRTFRFNSADVLPRWNLFGYSTVLPFIERGEACLRNQLLEIINGIRRHWTRQQSVG